MSEVDDDETAAPDRDAPAATPTDPMVWIRRALFVGFLIVGWVFILWQNQFRVTAPVVFVCLGFLAVVAAIYTLWRTGVVAVADEEDDGDSTWGRQLGVRGELEREKKTLLKAIKEAEFDREMGKLSKPDYDEMVAIYRGRAIEVIKELDKLDAGAAMTVREQIEREVKARVELDAKTKKAAADAKADGKKKKPGAKPEAKTEAKADTAKPDAKPASALEALASEVAATQTDDKAATDAPVHDEAVPTHSDDSTSAKEAAT